MKVRRLFHPVPHATGSLFGVLGEFETVAQVLAAAERVRAAGYQRFDVYSPIPIHGLDEAMGIRQTRLPFLVAAGGLAGALAGLALQWWTNGLDYPYRISGMPRVSLPASIPVAFELTILLAALGAVLGMLVANGLPELHHPLFRLELFRRASTDRFFVCIEAADPVFEAAPARELLRAAGARQVLDVER